MKKKFDKLNIKAYRFSAIDGETLSDDIVKKYNNLSKGAIGCMLSYYEIINDAKYNGYKKILIFEDDVLFDNKFNINFSNKIQNIKNWKMLHLGASQYNWNNIKYIDNFYYSNETQGTFSIAFDESIYDDILRTDNIINLPIDTKLFEIQKKYYKKCYTFFPNLTIADVSTSDIRHSRNMSNHSKIMKWNLDLYDDNTINILLCADIPGWAFDNIANAIIKYNKIKYIKYTKIFIRRNDYIQKKFKYEDWDYVFVFFEGDKNIPHNKEKLISGCYSAIWKESKILTKEYLSNRFNNCRATIFVNDDIKNEILPLCNNIDYTIINDSADPNEFYRDNDIEKNKEFTALFVGNTEREIKRFDAIKNICEMANVKLDVARNISHNELYKVYNKAHICINFSISEGGPQTFFEAALCETPMLINSDISMSKKIPCFSSNTEDGMIKILKELKNTPEKCIEKGKEAKDIVLNNYTYEKSANKFSNFFYEIVKKDKLYNNDITAFVISFGDNPNFDDCIAALNNQTMLCKIDIIKDYAPSSKAFQEMINRCKTKYYIQVDEDMILFPTAVEKMYESMSNSKNKDVMISYGLHDVHLDFDIIGIKIFNYDVYKKYPYDLDSNSNKIPTIEQLERIKKDGYSTKMNIKTVVGYHSPKWTTELIFERYFDLMEKYKIYKYTWLKNLPKKLENIYKEDPSDINYFAMMGAKTSIKTNDIRNRQKNYAIKDENYLKILIEYNKK
jgi:GR25 family glycosyltransferase involved in LPS biosynthesis